jgi:hypothetical protein
MADVPYAERIAWLASRKAGLDVHDPVLRLASAPLSEINWPTVYASGPKGHIDYPTLLMTLSDS